MAAEADDARSFDVALRSALRGCLFAGYSPETAARTAAIAAAFFRLTAGGPRRPDGGYQAVAFASLCLAAKLDERTVAYPRDLARAAGTKAKDLAAVEAEVANALAFDLALPLATDSVLELAPDLPTARAACAFACLALTHPGVARLCSPGAVARQALFEAAGGGGAPPTSPDDARAAAAMREELGVLAELPPSHGAGLFLRAFPELVVHLRRAEPATGIPYTDIFRAAAAEDGAGADAAAWRTASHVATKVALALRPSWEEIGRGTFGVAFGFSIPSSGDGEPQRRVAKVIREDEKEILPDTPSDIGIPADAVREAAVLRALVRWNGGKQHPRVVELFGARALEDHSAVVVTGRFGDGNLYETMRLKGPLSARDGARVCAHVAHAVAFLHSVGVLHLDIKPQNVLVDRASASARLADFGSAVCFSDRIPKRMMRQVTTLWYRAPEVLLELPYAEPADVWSLGCLVAEVALGAVPALGCVIERVGGYEGAEVPGKQTAALFQKLGVPSPVDWPDARRSKRWAVAAASGAAGAARDGGEAFFASLGGGRLERAARAALRFNPRSRATATGVAECLESFCHGEE